MKAAERQGSVEATRERIRAQVAEDAAGAQLVARILGGELGLETTSR